MTSAEAKAMWLRMWAASGSRSITLRRINVSPTPATNITVKAKARGYEPDELGGGIQQGSREIFAYADDVTFDPALRAGDKAVLEGGKLLNIDRVDDDTGRVGSDIVYYKLTATG